MAYPSHSPWDKYVRGKGKLDLQPICATEPVQGTQRSTGLSGTVTPTAELQIGPFIENLARVVRAVETAANMRWSDLRALPADNFIRIEMRVQTILTEQFDPNGDLMESGETTLGLLAASLELSCKNFVAARISVPNIVAP